MLKTTCNRDCPDACGILAEVEDGRVTRLRGDPEHPVTRGFLCYRTNRFLERQYDPQRITQPLIRRGSTFEPIEWSAALDLIAEKMLQIRKESGAEAIFNYRCGGSLGIMKHVTGYFFERFGPVAIKSGDICSGAGQAAQEADFGLSDSHDLFDLLNSRTIVLWGKNPFVSNVHLIPVLRDARERGAKLIQIDPVHHRGADFCDLYLQPRPGGDSALALGMLHRLFASGRTDPAAASYCDHLDELRAVALSHDLEEWAGLAGVAPGKLAEATELYAAGPSAILVGWGMQRRIRGAATVRAVDALAAVSGNLGIAGGGVSFYFRRRGAFDLSSIRGLAVAPRSIPEPQLGRGLLEATSPEYRMVWVSIANPVAMLPDSLSVARALESRELTVVVDSCMTDTARCAHIVLPTTTMLEDDDLLGAYGHHYLGNLSPLVEPPPLVKTDYEIVQQLARRVGLEEEFSKPVREWKQQFLQPIAGSGASLEELERGAVRNPLAPEVLFADRRFCTPNGKVNLIHEIDPTPPSATPERPLLLAALSVREAQSSQWPAKLQNGPATLTVHPEAAPAFSEGQTVLLESELASLRVVLKFDPRQRREMALMDKGGWLESGRCANTLVPAELTDAGGGAVLYDTPVRLLPLPKFK